MKVKTIFLILNITFYQLEKLIAESLKAIIMS